MTHFWGFWNRLGFNETKSRPFFSNWVTIVNLLISREELLGFVTFAFAKKQTWKVREWMTVWVWTHGGASINKCCIISICQKNVAIHTWRCHFSQCRRSDLERGRQQRAVWLTFHGGNTGNKGKKKKKTQVKTECVWTSNTRRKRQNQTNTAWEGEENGRTDRFCGRLNQTRKIKSQSCDWSVIRH